MTSRRRVVTTLLVAFSVYFILLSGCRSQNNIVLSLDSLVRQKVGPAAIAEYNPSKTYVLYKEADDAASYRQAPLKYVVFRLNDNHVALEGKFSRGYVKWLNDTMLEVLSIPEKVKIGQDLAVYKRQIYIEGP